MHLEHDFGALLCDYERDALDADPQITLGLHEDLRIAYANDAWDRFARDNGGLDPERWTLGVQLLSVVPKRLRPFYGRLFEQARITAAPTEHLYDCPSPEHYRRFHMRVFPLRQSGFLVTHALVVQSAHSGPACGPNPAVYRDRGLIVMCMHCRRTRRANTKQWDWVPDYVATQPDAVSHGLCEPCLGHYFPSRNL